MKRGEELSGRHRYASLCDQFADQVSIIIFACIYRRNSSGHGYAVIAMIKIRIDE